MITKTENEARMLRRSATDPMMRGDKAPPIPETHMTALAMTPEFEGDSCVASASSVGQIGPEKRPKKKQQVSAMVEFVLVARKRKEMLAPANPPRIKSLVYL